MGKEGTVEFCGAVWRGMVWAWCWGSCVEIGVARDEGGWEGECVYERVEVKMESPVWYRQSLLESPSCTA